MLLADKCPSCTAPVHACRQGLLGAMRALGGDERIHLERCTECAFDLRKMPTQAAPDCLLQSQSSYLELLDDGGEGTEIIRFFAVLRHIVSLLFGENRGLEEFRSVVSRHSSMKRVDIPIPYEPDVEILAFEESNIETRSQVLCATGWLMEEWPDRFIECCSEAEVKYPALNRPNSIRVRSFCKIAARVYGDFWE